MVFEPKFRRPLKGSWGDMSFYCCHRKVCDGEWGPPFQRPLPIVPQEAIFQMILVNALSINSTPHRQQQNAVEDGTSRQSTQNLKLMCRHHCGWCKETKYIDVACRDVERHSSSAAPAWELISRHVFIPKVEFVRGGKAKYVAARKAASVCPVKLVRFSATLMFQNLCGCPTKQCARQELLFSLPNSCKKISFHVLRDLLPCR